jgi:hypothetical protein
LPKFITHKTCEIGINFISGYFLLIPHREDRSRNIYPYWSGGLLRIKFFHFLISYSLAA